MRSVLRGGGARWMCVGAVGIASILAGVAAGEDTPVFALKSGADEVATVMEWLVIGPFPNPTGEPDENGVTRQGFGIDYLADLGGEAQAELTPEVSVRYGEHPGAIVDAIPLLVQADDNGVIDLNKAFGQPELPNKVAYASTWVDVDRDTEAHVLFGSDDFAKVWVNGELVYQTPWGGEGRACVPRQDDFKVSLKKGANRILVKVEQNTGPWAFILEFAGEKAYAAIQEEQARKDSIRRIMNSDIVPDPEWRWTFPPGDFPNVVVDQQELLEQVYGPVEVKVRWFDGQLNEVQKAEQTGRYAAYVEAKLPDGRCYRRARTFFCAPADWEPWYMPPAVTIEFPEGSGLDPEVWKTHQDAVGRWASGGMIDQMLGRKSGPAFLAGMSELTTACSAAPQLDWPSTRDIDYHVALKRQILGMENPCSALQPPRKRSTPATVLRPGTPEEAGVDPARVEAIRAVCREWAETANQPCTVLLARHGVVFLHEAFGNLGDEPIPLDAKLPLASLTKSHAGLVLAQFIDQGLISLDDPVGKFLPDFPVDGPKAITLRHCFTHTTGYEGHGEWGGLENPWLDNAMALGLDVLEPGKRYLYNGMGMDLGGKVMEVVSGKSIFRLMQEQLFLPLGDENVTIIDLGYGIDCSAEDLARYGQMILNKGSYGDVEFFSEKTFDEIVDPRPLKEFFPNLEGTVADMRYNLGLHYSEHRRTDVEVPEGQKAPLVFGEHSLEHGAASGAVLRVDFDNDLVVAMGRITPGDQYGEYLNRFQMAVVDALK